MKYLLDTNIISEPIKPNPNSKVIDNLKKYSKEIALPVFVIYELFKGAYQLPESKKRNHILYYAERTIIELPVLLYTEKAARWHGQESARLQSIGKLPAFIDAQIAAIAKTHDLILVTRNIDDFKYFDGLELENWFE
jgi:tRNA(fMet)-specific endonuclease VapC